MSDKVSFDDIAELEERSSLVIDRLRDHVFAPDRTKRLDLSFKLETAARMCGRTTQAVRDAESSDRLPEPALHPNGRRAGYSLSDVNAMRNAFNTRPWRDADDEPVILAVQNFKGGVGKSTLVTHIAQYLALKGYRVCIIDCDSQASTTTMFGINPDHDIATEKTILPFLLHGGENSLDYAVRKTYWDGLDLVPANLELYDAEYSLAARMRDDKHTLDRLRFGVDALSNNYDIILLDPPPALGMLSVSVFRAANAIIVPVPPSTIDFASTNHFLWMLLDTMEQLQKLGLTRSYKFFKILATKVNESKSAQADIVQTMEKVFGVSMLRARLKDSAEIDNATSQLMSVYELQKPLTSRETHNRCRASLDAVNAEIELLIQQSWPSYNSRLSAQGI
ncbi:MAG: AAA family ATPase [Geminicoccaceae bacterium]